MKKDKTEILLEYLDGNLQEEEARQLEENIRRSPALQHELETLRTILSGLDEQEMATPDDRVRHRFYQFIENESALGKVGKNIYCIKLIIT